MNKYFLAAILSVLAFSTIGPFVKLLAPDYPLPWITFARAFFAFVFVLLIVRKLDKKYDHLKKGDLKEYAIVGFFLAATMLFYNSALSIAPLADVVLLNYTHVFLSPVLAMILLREKMERSNWILFLIGFIGLVLINPFDGRSIEGNFLALGAGITYALMAVYMRKTDKHHGIGDVVWFLGFAALFLLIPALVTPITFTWHGFVYLALAGIISTGLGYLLFNIALEGLRVHQVSMLDLVLGTVLGMGLSVLAFHETLSSSVLLGGILLIGAGLFFLRHESGLGVRLKLLFVPNILHGTRNLPTPARPTRARRARRA